MCMCKKCSQICGALVLAAGVLFLLQDLGIWNFWGLSWYTVLFILGGVTCFASSKCPECNACCGMEPAKKGRKR